ncbi:uncharacterized protein N7498_010724 [Penicillium cinerascens]|uniref:Uncharacterized protein n=1 Tax=Penicillium cinerascens TaxID=70096 RepID=A0A9W9M7M0_9EURO|nr:uncharacterized protein N7498_010724 [Penicillium cinerascens]KAJ5191739.1 hypothetical protein N7498_010724 [Penicillium cinerascens]
MERKLSEKATKMRQRFTFTRGSQRRHRASTMNSSGATSTPNSRPRSSTTPVSSNSTEIAWHNTDPSRHYDFTDEPGYFRPVSPFISRQEIEEDLEDEITHACTMLAHDVEQELSILQAFDTELRPNTGSGSMVQALSETHLNSLDQMSLVLPHGATENEFTACKPMHDSGVAFSGQSSGRCGQPGRNSLSGTGASAGAGRFYGRRTPPEEHCKRGRQRGRSVATDVTSLRSRSRSRASSIDMFPYSPPQPNALWSHEIAKDIPLSDELFSEPESSLGVEGMTWLRASDDIKRLYDASSPSQSAEHVGFTPAPLSGPGPRRFYSTRQLPSKKRFGPRELSYKVRGSRGSSLHGGLSVRSLSFDEERDFSFDNDSRDVHSAQAYNAQNFYSLVVTPDANAQPRHKRKRASQLFKRLAGLGKRRKDQESFRNRRMDRPMVAAA